MTYGGNYGVAGVARRAMNNVPTEAWEDVAYKDKNTTLSTRMVFSMI